MSEETNDRKFSQGKDDNIIEVTYKDGKVKIITDAYPVINGQARDDKWSRASNIKPHDDFIAALAALRGPVLLAIEATGIKVARVTIEKVKFYDLEDEEKDPTAEIHAKVTNTTGVPTEWTFKTHKIDLANDENFDKKTSTLVKECWKYLNGKNGEPQLKIAFDTTGN